MPSDDPTLPPLTPNDIEVCFQLAGEVVTPSMTAIGSGAGKALNLDGSVLVDILAYKTLVPILVAVTSGLIQKHIGARDREEKSLNDLRQELKEFVGRPITLPEHAAKEELVQAVKAHLGQFAEAEKTARTLVDLVLNRLSERSVDKKESGSP